MIAASRNGGAAVAQGDLLCFIDADRWLHPDGFVAAAAVMLPMIWRG